MEHEYNENEEKRLESIVFNEVSVSKQNQSDDFADFESSIDLFDNERSEKEYDWMSDIPIPEFSSQMLTQASIDVSQYFQTRDFVETYIQDPSEEALLAADASEELLNRTLNRRNLYHYQKFVRAKTMNNIGGYCYAECGWTQEIVDGDIKKDYFWYDVLDPRNVFTDNRYCYSLQQKDYVITRCEKSLDKLKQEKKTHGYFNLKLLEELNATGETETKNETLDRDSGSKPIPQNKVSGKFDVYKRYGEQWITTDGEPGIDENGEVKENAELKELLITFAVTGGTRVLIGFHEIPYLDAEGNPFRPIIRGLCYVHPTRDGGVGDGHYARPLAIGINDTFNVSTDRTLLATMPVMKGKEYIVEDNDSVYIEPNHIIALNEPDDLQEMEIRDNIQAALNQIGVLTNKMQQTTSIFPTTMGDVPSDSSTTATAVMGADQRANQRSNYKSMTFEYSFLNELYWMVQQMTFQFARPETGFKLMGEKVFNFNPSLDFFYKPLSQSIETDSSKNAKIKMWTTILQNLASSQHPDVPVFINYILAQIVVLMGDEFSNIAEKLLGTDAPMQETAQGSPEGSSEGGPSNQYMIPQGDVETSARENTYV